MPAMWGQPPVITTRIKEQSRIHKHIKSNSVCDQSCDESCFTIIDSANTEYELKIKRLYIYVWAYGVVVSMFDFHHSDRGSNPGRGSKIS